MAVGIAAYNKLSRAETVPQAGTQPLHTEPQKCPVKCYMYFLILFQLGRRRYNIREGLFA